MKDEKAQAQALLNGQPEESSASVNGQATASLEEGPAEASPSQLAARRMAAWLRAGASVVALLVAVLSARVVTRRPVELDVQLGLVFLFWSVAPAVWFLFEYSWIWRRTGGGLRGPQVRPGVGQGRVGRGTRRS